MSELEVLVALNSPPKRRIYQTLRSRGPMNVSRLSAALSMQVGSVSHHLKALHRAGLAEPVPELGCDARESWWRGLPVSLSWTPEDYEANSLASSIATQAEKVSSRRQDDDFRAWMDTRGQLPASWRVAMTSDTRILATPAQVERLNAALTALVRQWVEDCRAEVLEPGGYGDAEARQVRCVIRVFPSRED